MDPHVVFQRSGRPPSRHRGQPDSQRTVTSVQFLRTETFPRGGEVVGVLVMMLGVAMGVGLAWGTIGTSEPSLARTSCCCLGRIVAWVPMSCLARARL